MKMCLFFGLGFFPLLALSNCNHTHEIRREDSNDVGSQSRGAIEILKERYAKGEIAKEQFLEMRKQIEA
jgi:uncharacterized membrane protein